MLRVLGVDPIRCGWSDMAFELKISFVAGLHSSQSDIKQRVLSFLEASGRPDYVEGVIDGVEMPLLSDEIETEMTTDDRLMSSPVIIFDDHRAPLRSIELDLQSQFPGVLSFEITEINDDAWQRCWNEEFNPLPTKRFWVVPLGHGSTTPVGLERIEIDAGDGAFGTGQHATTRAIIRLMEDRMSSWQHHSLLDVGTGTGIYLVLAQRLGVSKLCGTEISRDLVDLAVANCEAAGVSADIRLSDHIPFKEKFDVIIANILVPVLHDLMKEMIEHLAPGGRLVVAGFIEKEEGPLVVRALNYGLRVESMSHELGWRCLVLMRG